MSEYRTDEEQVEALKNWWDENGTSLILTVAISLAIVFGFRMWQADVKEKGEAASNQFQDLVDTLLVAPGQKVEDSAVQTSKYLAESLKSEHEGSTYAQFASLAMSKEAVEEGDLARAEQELRWAVDADGEPSIVVIARIRLARVLAAQQKYDDALATLEVPDAAAFRSSIEEAKGDIYVDMGRTEDARRAYTEAIGALAEKGAKPMLKMKLDDLAQAPAAANEAPAASSERPAAAAPETGTESTTAQEN